MSYITKISQNTRRMAGQEQVILNFTGQLAGHHINHKISSDPTQFMDRLLVVHYQDTVIICWLISHVTTSGM